jgi:soluble lytic murein transglycosylase-like protein
VGSDRLMFSTRRAQRARRRRRRARLVLAAWITCVIGAAAGIPFANIGVLGTNLIAGIEPARGVETSESATGMMRFRSASFKSRPSPSPTETETETYVPPAGSLSEIIYEAAAEFGLDGSYLLSVASCESALNVAAYNAAGYYGLFQFDHATWSAYGYGSIYDATAQARTAARLIAAGQASRWPNCA